MSQLAFSSRGIRSVIFILFALVFLSQTSTASELTTQDFSRLPDARGLSISPNGVYVASLVRLETKDGQGTAVSVVNVNTGERNIPIFGNDKKFKLNWL